MAGKSSVQTTVLPNGGNNGNGYGGFQSNAIDYSAWYTGGMAPPESDGNMVVQRKGLTTETGGGLTTDGSISRGLTTKKVTTVPIGAGGDPTLGAPGKTSKGGKPGSGAIMTRMLPGGGDQSVARTQRSTTQYFPQGAGVEYGYNTVTGEYEVKRPGQGYTAMPVKQGALDAVGSKIGSSMRYTSPAGPPVGPVGTPVLPVTATPEVVAAYNAMVAGAPGALKAYADVLANSAQRPGNIGASTASGRGSGSGSSSSGTIKGSSTGKTYAVGSKGTAGGYQYVATADGFKNVGKDPSYSGQSSANTYDQLAARSVDRGTGGEGGNPTWWRT